MGRMKGGILLPSGVSMERKALGTLLDATFVPPLVSGSGGIADLRPAMGPLGGMEAVLSSMEAGAAVFLPCDMPFITVRTVRRLIREYRRRPGLPSVIAVPWMEPLLAVVPVSFTERIINALDVGHLKVGRFWMDCGFNPVKAPGGNELHDVDHPWEVPA